LPPVCGDPTGVLQIFRNVLSNALKYRQPDRAPRIHITAREVDAEQCFAISDNGIGIEKEYCGKIFEIFRRLHREEEYPGTGVGLSVANRIVERHRGRMWVESTPGEGSTFFFTLPSRVGA
jgi:light-regulated signal transduction histidine kinase (bacteriophytochrome)